MQRSTDRILTTHTGSLPRPPDLADALVRRDRGEATDEDVAAFPELVRQAIGDSVRLQTEADIDVINDGEMSKIGYSTYVKERLTGFDGEATALAVGDLFEYPTFVERIMDQVGTFTTPSCTGPIEFRGDDAVAEDLTNLAAATEGAGRHETFMTAASPGVISLFLDNQHYPSDDDYLAALAAAMRPEFEAIHAAGLVLQLDCPDLAMGRHIQYHGLEVDQFLRRATAHVEALNEATRTIPADRIRLHLCWGNYEGPHHLDVPLADILPVVLEARAEALVIEAANPRHAHEWRLFEEVDLPDDKTLVPGVLDTTTNYIEHPELVAERIVRYANLVGRERVVAGTDCGFATFAAVQTVDPDITWAKLRALTEGAALASDRLW